MRRVQVAAVAPPIVEDLVSAAIRPAMSGHIGPAAMVPILQLHNDEAFRALDGRRESVARRAHLEAVLLRRAFEQSRETDRTVVIDGSYDHTVKLDAAATEIPEQSLRVGRRTFPPGAAATVPTDASADDWSVRLDASFVEWVPQALDGLEGRWHWGVKTDLNVLANSIRGVQASLSMATVEWT